ncbi:ABC transporter substrate-binding protein [Caballeronia sp. dw_19]|uniref:ABC transporter substrate-binding protein n=1 Tax=Caballeronia sp. dw_19 TaxID=2719791 RepID=UPI001BD6D674|nr:ABC transporter substrate-binding protein [Caballeronia sp. dw_19]
MGIRQVSLHNQRRRRLLKAAAGGIAALGGLPAEAGEPAAPAIDRDTIVIGLNAGFANLDGVVAGTGDSDRYTLSVFDRLYAFDRSGNLAPSLATSVEVAADGLAYVYRLRPGVKFHDGGTLGAADVKFTMEFALDPDTRSARRPYFAPYVDGIDVIDPLTVRFRLKAHDGAFQNKLAGYLPIIPHRYGSGQPAVQFFARSPIASGPYRVKSLAQDGSQLELERFDDYWGEKPAIKRIVFRAIKDDSNRINALLAGEVDLVEGVPAQDFARLNANRAFTAITNPVAAPLFVRPYTTDPALPTHHREVRQALNYAIDKDAFVKTVLQGIGEPLASGISRHYPYGADRSLQPYPYDPAKARALLAQAGFPRGFQTKLMISSQFPREISEAVAAYWAQVGVQAQIQVVDYATWILWNDTRRTRPMTVQMVANAIYDPAHPVGGLYVRSGTWSDYSNPEVESLFEEASQTVGNVARGRLFERIDRILHDDAAAVYLSEIHRIYGHKQALTWRPTEGTAALNFVDAHWS